MKILVVTQYFWPENFKINDLCDALIERGHEVTVYTVFPNYPEGSFFSGYHPLKGPFFEQKGAIKVIRCPIVPRGKNKGLQLMINYFSHCFLASLLAPFLVRGKFDKIFVYEPSPITVAIPGIVLRFLKNAPMFFWVTDLWPESLEATGTVKNKKILSAVEALVKILYKFSDRILVTSKGFIPQVTRLGAGSEKTIYFPQWAEALFLKSPVPVSDDKIPTSGFKVMFAGNIGSSQDFSTIIEAAKLLKNEQNIHFLVLGDGNQKSWAEEQIQKHELSKTFHLLGRRQLQAMPDYYAKADVMLMSLTDTPLFKITVPAKLQGYLASGKPILASMNGEGAEIVTKYNAGISVPASQPALLAEAILQLSKASPDQLKQMGENAKRCYEIEFDRSMLISRLETEFKNCELS